MAETCPACGKGFSSTCPLCRERTYRMTPLILEPSGKQFSWTLHRPVWDSPLMEGMHCEACGKIIRPDMMMHELFAPCSAGSIVGEASPP